VQRGCQNEADSVGTELLHNCIGRCKGVGREFSIDQVGLGDKVVLGFSTLS